MPPLGLLTVAAIIAEDFECRLVDTNIEPLTAEALAWADLVMISAMIVQADSFQKIVDRCVRAGVPVVAGGPYATSCRQSITGVDYFVLGEAEVTLPDFVHDYLDGHALPVYESDSWANMEKSPVPRYDLCDISAYNTMPVQFSRGCPFDCEFCDIVALFGHKTRTKSAPQFITEMQAAYDLGFRGAIFIVDDNFIGNRRRVKALLREILTWQRDRNFPFQLSTEASIDLARDSELMDLMAYSGFNMVFVGLETPVEESLRSTGKQHNLGRSMKVAVRDIQKRGIEVTAGFIVGFDTDPNDIFQRQCRFVQNLAVPTAMLGLLIALPNTRLFNRLQAEGRILCRSNGNNTHQNETNFITRLPKEMISAGYRRLLATVYEPRRYFARCLRFIARLPKRDFVQRLNYKRTVKVHELRALFLSLLKQGFSRYTLWYFLYVVRAVAMRPRQIIRIITLAIQGHHYFTITRQQQYLFS